MTAARLAVLDYGIGNLRSAQKALQHVGADARLTADDAEIDAADAVVLPGVGAFGACMEALARTGLDEKARKAAADGRPFVGICVGMQLLFEGSEEDPEHAGLSIVEGRVSRLRPSGGLPVPQMQWNRLDRVVDHPLFAGLEGSWMYFVHSYAASLDHPDVAATTTYGAPFASALARGNVAATQFHPEKSARDGLRLLENLCRWAVDRRS